MKPVVTIDGPSASGKSSLGRALAKKLGWDFLSTGVFYRGVAFIALDTRVHTEEALLSVIKKSVWELKWDAEHKQPDFFYLNRNIGSRLYTHEVDSMAVQVAGFYKIRDFLLPFQQSFLKQCRKGLVAEGRDCGTVVFPRAHLKIYLTASAPTRAKRRFFQKNREQSVDKIMEDQKNRDLTDLQRAKSPLKRPAGAFDMDTSQYGERDTLDKVYLEVCRVFKSQKKEAIEV